MKKYTILISVIILFLTTGCCAQYLVKSVADLDKLKLEQNQERFLGKSLNNLISLIKPEIRTVISAPDTPFRLSRNYFNFSFMYPEEVLEDLKVGKKYGDLTVTAIRVLGVKK